jgi:hypothetical protein
MGEALSIGSEYDRVAVSTRDERSNNSYVEERRPNKSVFVRAVGTVWWRRQTIDRPCRASARRGSGVRRLIAAVGVAAVLAVGAAPRQPYVKSITCDLLRGKYTNCQVTLWNSHQGSYATYPVSDKRTVFCFDQKLTDCVLRVWHPRLEKYRFYWGLSVDVTRLHGGG